MKAWMNDLWSGRSLLVLFWPETSLLEVLASSLSDLYFLLLGDAKSGISRASSTEMEEEFKRNEEVGEFPLLGESRRSVKRARACSGCALLTGDLQGSGLYCCLLGEQKASNELLNSSPLTEGASQLSFRYG